MSEETTETFFSTNFAEIMREIFVHLMNGIPENVRRSDAFYLVSGTNEKQGIAPRVRKKINKVYRSQAAFTPKARKKFVEIHWVALYALDLVIEQEGAFKLDEFLKMSNSELLEGARNARASHEG